MAAATLTERRAALLQARGPSPIAGLWVWRSWSGRLSAGLLSTLSSSNISSGIYSCIGSPPYLISGVGALPELIGGRTLASLEGGGEGGQLVSLVSKPRDVDSDLDLRSHQLNRPSRAGLGLSPFDSSSHSTPGLSVDARSLLRVALCHHDRFRSPPPLPSTARGACVGGPSHVIPVSR